MARVHAGSHSLGVRKASGPKTPKGGGMGVDSYGLCRLCGGETVTVRDGGSQKEVTLPVVEGVCSKNESHKKALWYLSIEGDGLVAVQCPCYECPRKSRGAVTAPPATTARDGTLGREGTKVVSHMTASRRKSEGKVHERKDVLWGKARACA